MAKLHNSGKNPQRMPMILFEADESRWLDPSLTEAEIKTLIKPFTAEPMSVHPISKDFRNMNLLARQIDEVPTQQKLEL